MTEATNQAPGPVYVRRGAKIAGPYPANQVKRYVVLGRILASDEVSTDREHWKKVAQVRGLQDALKSDPETFRREDERAHGDRRDREVPDDSAGRERHRGRERRRLEKEDIQRHREMKSRLLQDLRQRHHGYGWRPLLIVVVVLAVLVAGYLFMPGGADVSLTLDCNADPKPGLNWSNCRLDGLQAVAAELPDLQARATHLRSAVMQGANLRRADLSYADLSLSDLSNAHLEGAVLKGASLLRADLSYARLNGADLSYADLGQANLGGADLQDAVFDHAVWIDGRTCAPGSRGGCRP